MGHADYFVRAGQAASHVLGGLDQNAFLNKVNRHRVAIAFDSTVRTSEGAALVDLLIRLIARFYPFISLHALEDGCGDILSRYIKLSRSINPKIGISQKLSTATEVIVIGKIKIASSANQKVLYVGSENWIVRLSPHNPVSVGNSNNPIGAGMAACLAAANIFRVIFTSGAFDDDLTISSLELDSTSTKPLNPSIDEVKIGKVFLIGAGAIGNGFLWGLQNSKLLANIIVVEHDTIDLGNLQRYVLTERKDENKSKASFIKNLFHNHLSVSVNCIPNKWEDYLKTLPEDSWKFEKVVVALDSANDRIGVQSSLPLWVVNGWTQQGEIGVSRHNFIGEEACMACLYMPQGEVPHQDEMIADALGFSKDPDVLRRLRALIETSQPLDQGFLREVAIQKSVPFDKLATYEGKTINELYATAICSGMIMEMAAGPAITRAEVPMPFQSALAGILQLASVIAHSAKLHNIQTITQFDMLKPIPRGKWFNRQQKKNLNLCFCHDPIFQNIYMKKYQLKT